MTDEQDAVQAAAESEKLSATFPTYSRPPWRLHERKCKVLEALEAHCAGRAELRKQVAYLRKRIARERNRV